MVILEFLKNDLERADYLQNLLITQATGGTSDLSEYKELRDYFLEKPEYDNLLPDFIRTKRDFSQFWSFIKYKFPSYAERREFIWNSFLPLISKLEKSGKNSISESLSSKQLESFGENAIHYEIQKGLERIKSDPDGAITMARTTLESTCKFIADKMGIKYADKDDLSVIYKNVAKNLNLSPDQHSEEVFKQILGGCSAVVNGLGTLRNKLGDAHGRSALRVKPDSRHAELAINLAGSMAIFLIETFESLKIKF
jgi:hypothetical protein